MCFRRRKTTLTTLATSYIPKFPDGVSVHFKWANAKLPAVLHFGDGETMEIPTANGGQTKMIATAGRLRASIRDKGGRTVAAYYYVVEHVPPVVNKPFITGALQLLNPVLIDTNYQEHSCAGGGTDVDKYGVEVRPGERVQVAIEVKMINLRVYYSAYEDNVRVVQWIIGADNPPHFPSDKPVLTPTGLWRPGDPIGSPTPSCTVEDRRHAVILVKVRNQFGSETILMQNVNWAGNDGTGTLGGCMTRCSGVR